MARHHPSEKQRNALELNPFAKQEKRTSKTSNAADLLALEDNAEDEEEEPAEDEEEDWY